MKSGTDVTVPSDAGSDETLRADSTGGGHPNTGATRVVIPGYTVGERLGAGGFGEVFRARHDVIGRDVAIKVLHDRYSADPEAVGRFIAEARAVSQISHPGIVDLFEFGKLADGRQYAVMELIRGHTLREVLRTRGRLPVVEALPILRGIAEAIDAAHAAGIAHRDLKPDNVFVVDAGGVKVIDFGLAKLTRDDPATTPVTQTGSVFGTPLYMSPEQCRGEGVDMRTDCYSFGVLAYQVLTGELPFAGDALALALRHLHDTPISPSARNPELDARVDRVVLACLAKEPDQRPASLAAAVAALAGDAVLPDAPGARRRRRAVLGVAILVGASVIGALAMSRSSSPAVVAPDPVATCVAASERLRNIWDPPVRSALEARFAKVDRIDAPGTWRFLSRDLDAYSARWSTQWTDACRSTDRARDPLLHAQRLDCLETALLDLRGISEAMKQVDLALFTQGWIGTFLHAPLENCLNVDALRAQPPAPPPEQRDEITKLVLEIHVARAEVRVANNAGNRDHVGRGMARFVAADKRLAELRAPAAATAAMFHAGFLENNHDSPAALEQARAAVKHSIERAREVRNDVALMQSYLLLARLEPARVPGHRDRIADALSRAEEAHARAGRPIVPLMNDRSASRIKAELEMMQGHFESAVAILQADQVSGEARQFVDYQLPMLLAALGRHPEAIADARKLVTERLDDWGAEHPQTAVARTRLEFALARSGDFAGALAELEPVIGLYERLPWPPERMAVLRIRQMAYGLRLGRADVFDAGVAGHSRVTTLDPATGRDRWFEISKQASEDGHIELRTLALARSQVPAADDERVLAAYELGDHAAIVALSRRVLAKQPPNGPDVSEAFLLLPIAQFHLGDPVSAERSLVRVRANAARFTDPRDRANMLVVIANIELELGRWKAARLSLEKARTADAYGPAFGVALGRVSLETGDPTGAIEPLELVILSFTSASSGFNYRLPDAQFALGRALWETKGDPRRARYLVEQARDGFARLGTFKDAQRTAAIRWLDNHPAK